MGQSHPDKVQQKSDEYRAKAIAAYLRGQISAADLEASLEVSRTHMFRLIKRYEADGINGLRSKKVGIRNRAHTDAFRKQVIDLVREHYPDFGPQFASEKLKERHGIRVGVGTLRNWMIEEGNWETRQKKEPRIFQLREPRPQRGELIQVDGSYHRWFEKRGREGCVIVFIDDATSELMELEMVEHESAFNYMKILRRYIERYGRPRALYSDRHSIFRSTNAKSSGERSPTQFALACRRLNIDIICAETPQAKGRVERANRTLQDRLVKELRLRNISTFDDANKYLEVYRKNHNARFARPPADPEDAHLPRGNFDLNQLLTYSRDRKVFKDLSLSFNRMGRVERCHRTLQDRLVKAMRRAGICTIAEANAFAPEFIDSYNGLFAKPPAREGDSHRPPASREEIDRVFSRQVYCRVTTTLTFSFGASTYVIGQGQGDRDQIGRKVLVESRLDGTIVVSGECGQLKVYKVQ